MREAIIAATIWFVAHVAGAFAIQGDIERSCLKDGERKLWGRSTIECHVKEDSP